MAPPKSTPLVSLKIWPHRGGGRPERPNATPTPVVDGVARVDQHGVVYEAEGDKGNRVEDEDLAQSLGGLAEPTTLRTAAGGRLADAANPDDGVALHALAVVTPAILPFVELAAVHARHALVAELMGTLRSNVTPVADVGDARRATPAAAATAARRIMAATRTRRSSAGRGARGPPSARSIRTSRGNRRLKRRSRVMSQTSRRDPVSMKSHGAHRRRTRSLSMGDVIFADIVDVGGRRFRKQSGSIGETLERVRARKEAEWRRRAALPEEEEEDGHRQTTTTTGLGGRVGAPRRSGSPCRCSRSTREGCGPRSSPRRTSRDTSRATTPTPSPNSDATTTRPSRSRARRPRRFRPGSNPRRRGSILVVAPSLHAARDAKRALDLALERALRSPKLQYTHFVCVPLCFGDDGERLVATVRAFHRDVLSSAYAADCDIEPSIAHEPGHAHLTLCMLKLYSDEARARAIGAMDARWESR